MISSAKLNSQGAPHPDKNVAEEYETRTFWTAIVFESLHEACAVYSGH
jgi:hypothetical protein